MSKPVPTANHVTFGDNAENVTAVGGDNNGVINNYTTAVPTGVPPHRIYVEKRWATPITDQRILVLNLIMTVGSVTSIVLGVIQTVGSVNSNGLDAITNGITPAYWAIMIGTIALVVAILGWVFWRWLRSGTYNEHVLFGRVPEGRRDDRGHNRLYFTKLRGTCAIDGSEMIPQRVPTRWETRVMPDGSPKTRYYDYILQMSCRKLGRKDNRHRGKVDLSDTEAE